jgi:hypothetical protein
LTKIKLLTGATLKFIKQAVANPASIIPGKCSCRYCPDKEFTQDEVEYLCSDNILNSAKTFSLL